MIKYVSMAAACLVLALNFAACSKPASTTTDSATSPAASESETPAAEASESPEAAASSPETTAPAAPSSAAPSTEASGEVPATTAVSPAESPSAVGAAAGPSGKHFADLQGVFGASQIAQVAQLGVFDTIATPDFQPNKPVLRREFVRWLFIANNALQTDAAKQVHPAPAGETPYFKDVASSDADFAPIQGMQDAGISVGFPDKTFEPDVPITREQSLAVAAALNCAYTGVWSNAPNEAYAYLPPWRDSAQVSKTYAPILAGCGSAVNEIAGRAFGKVATIRPKAPVLRGEAALMMWKVNNITAAQALAAAAPAPTATP